MRFNVDNAVSYILDEDNSTYVRAIRLFQLQVALATCSGPARIKSGESETSFIVNVPRDAIRDARVLATLKMLEHIEKSDAEAGIGKHRFLSLLEDTDYRDLLWRLHHRYGGFERVRYTTPARDFDDRMKAERRQCKHVARMADFSIRVVLDPAKPRRRGGSTMALDVVTEAKSFDVKASITTLKNWYRPRETVLAFLHLIYVQKFYILRPHTVATSAFASRLLRIVENRDGLLECFSMYRHVQAKLAQRNYKVPQLHVAADLPDVALSYDPLPSDAQDSLDSYRQSVEPYRK